MKANNNYNCLMQLMSALNNGDVAVTKKERPKMWKSVPPKLLSEWEEVEDFMLPLGNFKKYREQFQNCLESKAPIVPYLPIHLRDLIYINENPDLFEELPPEYDGETPVVNYEKIQLIGKEIFQLSLVRDSLFMCKFDYDPRVYKLLVNLN